MRIMAGAALTLVQRAVQYFFLLHLLADIFQRRISVAAMASETDTFFITEEQSFVFTVMAEMTASAAAGLLQRRMLDAECFQSLGQSGMAFKTEVRHFFAEKGGVLR
jgi:hypothetical protein